MGYRLLRNQLMTQLIYAYACNLSEKLYISSHVDRPTFNNFGNIAKI